MGAREAPAQGTQDLREVGRAAPSPRTSVLPSLPCPGHLSLLQAPDSGWQYTFNIFCHVSYLSSDMIDMFKNK